MDFVLQLHIAGGVGLVALAAVRFVAVAGFGKRGNALARVLVGLGVFQLASGLFLLLPGGASLMRVCLSAAATLVAVGGAELLLRAVVKAGARP